MIFTPDLATAENRYRISIIQQGFFALYRF